MTWEIKLQGGAGQGRGKGEQGGGVTCRLSGCGSEARNFSASLGSGLGAAGLRCGFIMGKGGMPGIPCMPCIPGIIIGGMPA